MTKVSFYSSKTHVYALQWLKFISTLSPTVEENKFYNTQKKYD